MPVAKKKHIEKPGAPLSTSTHRLSKSRFCTAVQCLKALYFQIHEPELAAPIDAAQQMIFDQGTQVGIEARKRYPGGILIELDYMHSKEALKFTQEAIAHNPSALFEGAFYFHNTLVRIDILKRNNDGTWDIIEVKSTTDIKDQHIPDIAIQRYVAEGAGLKISRTILKHLNRDCIFPDLENLFVDVDCTNDVNEELQSVSANIQQMLGILEQETPPDIRIGTQCASPYECSYKSKCWADIPEHSVFELNGVWDKTKFELYHRGIARIEDIPHDEKVSRAKPQQLKAVRTKLPVIDKEGLKSFIDSFTYPLFFLDFETINPAIPQLPGLSPYSQLPFQYSCHVINKKGGDVVHLEYLADGSGDPRTEIADRLLKDLGTKGTILAYNQSFEKTRINELARQLPSIHNELLELLPRFLDLKDAFSKHFYHPDFHGSFSIKDVLPVLVPSMTYEGMAVCDGGGAQVVYLKLCDPNTPEPDRAVYQKQLLEYCKQDTFAMVVLLSKLQELVNV